MMLAFQLSDIVTVPFGWILAQLYRLTSNYGIALMLFAVLVKILLYPVTAKAKKSSMKMSRLTPRMQVIQKKYENDKQKQSEAIQALYKEEGVSMGGGCLWSFVPLLIMFPLYTVVRQPITYMLGETVEVAEQIIQVISAELPDKFTVANEYFAQMIAAPLIPQFAEQIRAVLPNISEATLQGVNFTFLGIDLGATPQFNVFAWEAFNWANVGLFLVPVLSAASQVLSMFIAQKQNNSVITNEKGIQDKEAAKNSQSNQQGKMMMWMMPLMSLWIGFGMPGGLSLYWFIQGIVSTVMDIYLTKKYRKIYDTEDALRLQKAIQEELAELEKERIRAERRAANPDGITSNTSKKKLQQAKQKEEAEAKAAAAKEYAAKKGTGDAEVEQKTVMSGIAERPYCKGRNYDPNRYASQPTEE